MDETKTANIFISLFSKIFGSDANIILCLLMFLLTDPGGQLLKDLKVFLKQVKRAADTPEGEKLLEELKKAL